MDEEIKEYLKDDIPLLKSNPGFIKAIKGTIRFNLWSLGKAASIFWIEFFTVFKNLFKRRKND